MKTGTGMQGAKFVKNLTPGDLILVNYPSGMEAAIYVGEGSRNNPNFYTIIRRRLEYAKANGRKIYKDYINRDFDDNIVRVDVNQVDNETRQLYIDYMEYLKEIKAL